MWTALLGNSLKCCERILKTFLFRMLNALSHRYILQLRQRSERSVDVAFQNCIRGLRTSLTDVSDLVYRYISVSLATLGGFSYRELSPLSDIGSCEAQILRAERGSLCWTSLSASKESHLRFIVTNLHPQHRAVASDAWSRRKGGQMVSRPNLVQEPRSVQRTQQSAKTILHLGGKSI